MKDIVTTRKMENGVAVYYLEGNEKKLESFNYSELIDLKINALDLLDNPKAYQVNQPPIIKGKPPQWLSGRVDCDRVSIDHPKAGFGNKRLGCLRDCSR